MEQFVEIDRTDANELKQLIRHLAETIDISVESPEAKATIDHERAIALVQETADTIATIVNASMNIDLRPTIDEMLVKRIGTLEYPRTQGFYRVVNRITVTTFNKPQEQWKDIYLGELIQLTYGDLVSTRGIGLDGTDQVRKWIQSLGYA